MVGEIYDKELQDFPKRVQGSSSKGSCRKRIEKKNRNKIKPKNPPNFWKSWRQLLENSPHSVPKLNLH